MLKCTFCGKAINPGTGTMFVKNDGRIFIFCSNKCDKSFIKLGRKARFLKWTSSYVKGITPTEKRTVKEEETILKEKSAVKGNVSE